jgi:hypothetical protein
MERMASKVIKDGKERRALDSKDTKVGKELMGLMEFRAIKDGKV